MANEGKSINILGVRLERSTIKRYLAMLNICILGLGTFVSFDSVGALQDALMKKFDISFSQFSLMYSVNCWANIVISPFGGFLIDRVFGMQFGTVFYSVVFVIGHLVFSAGVTTVLFWCSLLGRLINGIGHEFVYISMQLYSVHYFKGKELSMVMGLNVSLARLGSPIVYSLSEPLVAYVKHHYPGSADIGIVVFIFGSFTLLTITSSAVLMLMTPKAAKPDEKAAASSAHDTVKFKEIFILPLEFWLLIIIQISFAISIYVFLPFNQKMFEFNNQMTIDEANSVTSFFNLIGVVFALGIGIAVDRLGREVFVIQAGCLSAFLAHFLLGFTAWTPYIGMLFLSLSYGLFNGSVLPMMAFLIPEHKLGTAYGVSMTFGNGAYALSMYLAGISIDYYGYVGLSVFMLIIVAGGFAVTVYLYAVDRRARGMLNVNPKRRLAMIQAKTSKEVDETTEPLKSDAEANGSIKIN